MQVEPGTRCPADGNLQDPAALDAMLNSRATFSRDILILILGWTHGGAQVTMRESGAAFVEAQVSALGRFGLGDHYVVVTPRLPIQLRAHRVKSRRPTLL